MRETDPKHLRREPGSWQRTVCLIAMITLLVGCAPRGALQFGEPVASGAVQDVWVAKFRSAQATGDGQRAPPRPTKMRFEMNAVSIPETHMPGAVEWPKGEPDASTDFVTVSAQEYPTLKGFASQIARSDKNRTGGTVLFVHGYNVTHGEAVYQLAQVSHDFELPSPTVLFSWPSAAVAAGYVYDRDSVLFARDQLEDVIVALTRSGRKVTLMAHSMGGLLVMETLRQIEISGSLNIGAKIDALFMISPDIDGELFQTQAKRLKRLPDPTVIVAARQDRALRISAILTGKKNRLGSQTDRSAVGDLPITVIDVSELSDGGLSHSVALSSPAAIAILKNLDGASLPAEAQKEGLLILGQLR